MTEADRYKDIVQALVDMHGCGCCAEYETLHAVLGPCPERSCPTHEGEQLHDYGVTCLRVPKVAAEALVDLAVSQALGHYIGETVKDE